MVPGAPGSMSDKVILDQVLSMMKKMEVPRFTFVGDRGFIVTTTLSCCHARLQVHHPGAVQCRMAKKLIAEHRDTLVRPGNLIEENGSIMYGKTIYKTTPLLMAEPGITCI